jgi:acetyltransferase-like isoleucine patch superfamily enzyme
MMVGGRKRTRTRRRLTPRHVYRAVRKRLSSFERLKRQGRIVWGEGSYGVPGVVVFEGDHKTRLIVGRYCGIASTATFLLGGVHPVDRAALFPFRIRWDLPGARMDGFPDSNGDIVVEDGAWVAHEALVLSGVRIGRGSIVAAGAVVTKDVPPYWIVGGNPAVPIRQRVDDDAVAAIEASRWWERDRDEIVRTIDELNGEVLGAQQIKKPRRVRRSPVGLKLSHRRSSSHGTAALARWMFSGIQQRKA